MSTIRGKVLGLLGLGLLGISAEGNAIPITYQLELPTMGQITATGTITTNGNVGQLAAGDILSYSIFLYSSLNQESFNLTESNSQINEPFIAHATTSELYLKGLDGPAGGDVVIFEDQNAGDGSCYNGYGGGAYCGELILQIFDGSPYYYSIGAQVASINPQIPFDHAAVNPLVTGSYVFATATVPTPPAVWLLGSALGLMGVMRRKVNGI
jgi:hypothetical protein